MSKKYTYEDLQDLLTKIYKETRIESALSIEWANYPVEIFDELAAVICDMTLDDDNE